jgi:ferric-dicitrate binding protein FerR (iron transport regulator)
MDNEINEIISRVLSGDATSEEIHQLLHWFNKSEENPKDFAKHEMLWNALEIIGRKHEFNTERAYQKFTDRIEGAGEKKSLSFFYRISRIAAMLVFASGLAFLAGYYLRPATKQSTTCKIVTPKGSKAYIELADGSKVWLNAESKLTYPETFSENSRDVYLDGEGYFEVAKNKDKPFIVHTSKINIRAIGTAFNVKSYSSEDIIQTTLVEGSVAVEKQGIEKGTKNSNQSPVVYLKPNQQATFYKTTSVVDVNSKTSVVKAEPKPVIKSNDVLVKKDSLLFDEKVNTDLFISWKENKLVFDNEPFESLSVKLERQFNMKCKFMDEEIKAFRFTGKFNEISVEQLFAALQYASPFHYVINENDIHISLKPLQKVR